MMTECQFKTTGLISFLIIKRSVFRGHFLMASIVVNGGRKFNKAWFILIIITSYP